MKAIGYTLLGLVALALVIALAFVAELGGLRWSRFFGPRKEAVRREVFRATRSYNESKTQDLARYRLQYLQADAGGKAALASTIRIMFADYNADLLPRELAVFLFDVRGY